MLKIIRFEVLIIGILSLGLLITNAFDIEFYNYSLYLKNSFQQTYLKEFFQSITVLGDSLWYFLISIACIAIHYFFKKSNILNKLSYQFEKIHYYNLLLFSSVLNSGVLAQLIKHMLGRPRPNVVDVNNDVYFNFFTFDSSFHSFPSGHASTIFAVALVFSLIAPKLKIFFFILAIVIAFSRIVVGAHFITDVVAGIFVALIGFKISKFILFKILKINPKSDQLFVLDDNFKLVIITFILLAITLTISPTFDIFFSKLFQNESGNFLLQSHYFNLEIFNYSRGINPAILFRKLFLPVVLFYILILPFFSNKIFSNKLYFGHIFNLKEIVFLWLSSLVGLIFIINLALKNLWGRSRPNDIVEFGGPDSFTPWFLFGDQCISNCSFVSGDASVGFALIVFYFIVKKQIYIWIALIIGFSLGLIRIMEGGHFTSDVILSGMVMFSFYFLCHNFFIKRFNA